MEKCIQLIHCKEFIIALLFLFSVVVIEFNPKGNKFTHIVGALVVFFITFYSKSQWCFFALIIFIALKLGLVDKKFLEDLYDMKSAWNATYKEKKLDTTDKEEIIQLRLQEANIDRGIIDEQKKKTILYEYKQSEKAVFAWFMLNKKIFFKTGLKVLSRDKEVIYPDGIYETDTKYNVLEVKHCFNENSLPALIQKGIGRLHEFRNFYRDFNKSVDCYFAIVLKNTGKITLENTNKTLENGKIDAENILNNIDINGDSYIYVFEQQQNELMLVGNINL